MGSEEGENRKTLGAEAERGEEAGWTKWQRPKTDIETHMFVKNKCMDTKGGKWEVDELGDSYWHIQTLLLCIKFITSWNILYNTERTLFSALWYLDG